MNIKHSKYKNTGILFELLVRQITSDTLSGKDSKAAGILKKFFVKTELGKEYKLYETLSKHKNLTEGKSEIIVNTLVESSKNLNRGALKRQKYNLIQEIQKHYNLECTISNRTEVAQAAYLNRGSLGMTASTKNLHVQKPQYKKTKLKKDSEVKIK